MNLVSTRNVLLKRFYINEATPGLHHGGEKVGRLTEALPGDFPDKRVLIFFLII